MSKPMRFIRSITWAQWAAFWGCFVVLFAVLATIGIWVDVNNRNTPPPYNASTSPPRQWSSNLLANPSFELTSTVGNLAIHWVPKIYGYSLITDIGSYNGSDQFQLSASLDTVIDPVIPYEGNVALRLGSTLQPIGEDREYEALQRLLFQDEDDIPDNWMYANFSAWCNPTYVGLSTSTFFYVSLEPIFATNSSTPWETRLFFSFGLPSWEYEEKVVQFAESDIQQLIGFQVSVHLETKENVVWYCDDLKLLLE